MSTAKVSDSDVYGRIEGYGITVQLYNDSADKGLKGVELPTGEITFDISLTTTVGGKDMTQDDDYHPLLWDYEEATAESVNKTGHMSRTMAAFGVSRASYAYLTPGNKEGATDRYCYDGGGWSITQNRDYSLSVTLDGKYLFDEKNFVFPDMAWVIHPQRRGLARMSDLSLPDMFRFLPLSRKIQRVKVRKIQYYQHLYRRRKG